MAASFPPAAVADWAYFLDVDGTLIAIADTPGGVRADKELFGLLAQLYQASGGALALVSGRAINDLESHLNGLSIPIAGLHGLERRDANGHLHVHAAPAASMTHIRDALSAIVARHPGLLLEDKGLALALHYRRAPQLASYAHRIVAQLAVEARAGLEVQRGKRVAEIKPAGFDKGSAVLEYLKESPFVGRIPVYIGDDLTDEHGFAVVNELDGISIKVGPGRTCARFRVPDVAAVKAWLDNAARGRHAQP
jgi:trehalose 6-phosphate phosphatase